MSTKKVSTLKVRNYLDADGNYCVKASMPEPLYKAFIKEHKEDSMPAGVLGYSFLLSIMLAHYLAKFGPLNKDEAMKLMAEIMENAHGLYAMEKEKRTDNVIDFKTEESVIE